MKLNIDELKSELPLIQLKEIWEFEKLRNDHNNYSETGKYIIRIDEFLKEKIDCFRAMDLHKEQGKHILDIGTGVGYFPWLCKRFGHRCDFTDCAPPKFYKLVWPVMGLGSNHIDLCITGQKDFKLPGTYDIITAHRTVFDIAEYHWHVDEYKRFLRCSARYLNDGGFVFIKTNLSDHDLHRPHPEVIKLFSPYLADNFNSLTFKMTKRQIEEVVS